MHIILYIMSCENARKGIMVVKSLIVYGSLVAQEVLQYTCQVYERGARKSIQKRTAKMSIQPLGRDRLPRLSDLLLLTEEEKDLGKFMERTLRKYIEAL